MAAPNQPPNDNSKLNRTLDLLASVLNRLNQPVAGHALLPQSITAWAEAKRQHISGRLHQGVLGKGLNLGRQALAHRQQISAAVNAVRKGGLRGLLGKGGQAARSSQIGKLSQAAGTAGRTSQLGKLGQAAGAAGRTSQLGKLGQLASGAGRLGAAAAKGGAVLAATALYIGAVIKATNYLNKFSAQVIDTNLKLAAASPSMAMVAAQNDMSEFFRRQRKGEALAADTGAAVKARNRYEDAVAPIDIWWNKQKAGISSRWEKGWANIATGEDSEGKQTLIAGALSWITKQYSWGSQYYKTRGNQKEIEEERAARAAKGDADAVKKLDEILRELKKANDAAKGPDLSGWIAQGAEAAKAAGAKGDSRIAAMRKGNVTNDKGDFMGPGGKSPYRRGRYS